MLLQLVLVQFGAARQACAQTTHVVGQGGFGDLAAAIAAARDGDTILVTRSQVYGGFVLQKSLTIRSAAGVSASVLARTPVAIDVRGRIAEIAGIDFTGASSSEALRIDGGTVVLRHCHVASTLGCGGGGAVVVVGAELALQHCVLESSSPAGCGLLATDATVSAVETLFRGGTGCLEGFPDHAGDGIVLERSRFHGNRIAAFGGGGGTDFLSGRGAGSGIVVGTGSRAWLTDGWIAGGVRGASARDGDGIVNLDRSLPVESSRVSAFAGGPSGAALVGLFADDPTRPALVPTPGAFALGATETLRVHAAPGSAIALLGSTAFAPGASAALAQPSWLGLPPPPVLLAIVVADASGTANAPIAIPGFSALRGHRLVVQGAQPTATTAQLTAVVGGQLF